MGDTKPSWQSTVIAVALMVLVGGIFIVVYLKSGIDDAIQAWGVIGPLIGVLVGGVPTYFFGQRTTETARAQAAEALKQVTQERQQRERADAKTLLVAELADKSVLEEARRKQPELFK